MTSNTNRIVSEIVGQSIVEWKSDPDLSLIITGGDEHTGLSLGPFSIFQGGTEIYSRETLGDIPTSSAMKLIEGKKIIEASVGGDGTLDIALSDNFRISVRTHADVEAWELRWKGFTLVGLPGGGFEEF